MIIRNLRKDEFYKGTMGHCYANWDKADIEEAKKQELTREVIGAFDDDNETLYSQISLHSFESSYCGQAVPALGIGGVATAPMYRRSGGVRNIFNEIFLHRAQDRGWIFSYLYPFSFPYYRRYGYERIAKWQNWTLPISALEHIPRYSNVTLYQGENTEHLLALYNEYALRYEVAFQRFPHDKIYSKTPFQSGCWTFYTDNAYVTLEIINGDTLKIHEIIYRDVTSLTEILGFLRMYDGQVDNVFFNALPEHSELDYILSDYGSMKIQQENSLMGRVVLVEKAFELYRYPIQAGSVTIRVEDSLPFNQGVFHIQYENGRAVSVMRDENDAFDIQVTIPALTRLLLGDVPPIDSMMRYMPGITWHCDPSRIRALFPTRNRQIFTRF